MPVVLLGGRVENPVWWYGVLRRLFLHRCHARVMLFICLCKIATVYERAWIVPSCTDADRISCWLVLKNSLPQSCLDEGRANYCKPLGILHKTGISAACWFA